MRNFKTSKFILGFGPAGLLLPDETAHLRLSDRLQKRLQFFFDSFGRHLDSAIFQVADRPGDFKALREGFDRITEPDTLHVP